MIDFIYIMLLLHKKNMRHYRNGLNCKTEPSRENIQNHLYKENEIYAFT